MKLEFDGNLDKLSLKLGDVVTINERAYLVISATKRIGEYNIIDLETGEPRYEDNMPIQDLKENLILQGATIYSSKVYKLRLMKEI